MQRGTCGREHGLGVVKEDGGLHCMLLRQDVLGMLLQRWVKYVNLKSHFLDTAVSMRPGSAAGASQVQSSFDRAWH
jgi:hypothetical protein